MLSVNSQQPTVNSQQSTVNNDCGATEIDITSCPIDRSCAAIRHLFLLTVLVLVGLIRFLLYKLSLLQSERFLRQIPGRRPVFGASWHRVGLITLLAAHALDCGLLSGYFSTESRSSELKELPEIRRRKSGSLDK